ncbi:MAG: FtsX-like permease family protein [Planctomycetes bacterium]|nr:FtsX-like permease family protein [Planctomycetota bacterium]
MYKLLLCWRYLRTRWIALASIVSVTLGVATMIVVNAVMAGFSHEMQTRIHGILSDLVFESHSLSGFQDPQWHMDEIKRAAGDDIVGMTPTVAVPAMLNFQVRGQWITRQIMLIGIDEATHAQVSDFGRYLQHPANRGQLSFGLRDGGYDTIDSQSDTKAVTRPALEGAGWPHRRMRVERERVWREKLEADRRAGVDAGAAESGPARSVDQQVNAVLAATAADAAAPSADQAADQAAADPAAAGKPADPFRQARPEEGTKMDPAREQFTGIVPGIGLASFRDNAGTDRFLVLPGDDVKITFPTAGTPPKAVSDTFTVVDFYESKMSEYDSNFVFVPIASLQRMRGMIDPQSGLASVNSIQIKLREGADLDRVRDTLRKVFPADLYAVSTWRDKQGPLLAAVDMEMSVLNILLFLIIAVAGFGILAIFFMIVVEKTRDIGILKSLGASAGGIGGIFLGYGLFLGIVGAGAGLALGLSIAWNINSIRAGVEWCTGERVFDPSIYYFYRIPSIVHPFTVLWIIVGAVGIAVGSSVLPALRAARLHPVEALRHD